jgi:tRNA A-37 threonylcarbamoyl transferase component Bud32
MSEFEPKTIGRYKVERLLGAGGMGAVYLAEDPMLKRRLAVKVVHAGGAQKEILARFHREAEVSARLNHPNVITIYDVGEDPEMGPFIAMEFIDGSSLADLVHDEAIHTAEGRLRILVPAMHAVEAAHAAGIVHRDIKPANLMVGRDGRVKLMDFGIARGDDSSLTATGAVIGTPAYLAPEQLKGADPSESTDRYAFSVMAFELFTGTKPYVGPTTSTLLYNIAHEHPVFPEGFSTPLRKLFEKALAKEPSERYPDLKNLLAALVAVVIADRTERDRWLTELLPEHGLGGTLGGEDAAEDQATAGVPVISEGASGRTLLLFGAAGLAAVIAAIGGIVYFSAPGHGSGKIDKIKKIETLASARPTESAASVMAQPTAPPTVLPSPVPATPIAAATLEPSPATPQSLASVDRATAEVEAPPRPPLPTVEELRDTVVKALRKSNLTHVDVRVTSDRRVVLANLRDAVEAERARLLAVRATEGEVPIDTSLRTVVREPQRAPERREPETSPVAREPIAPVRPAWQIHREGSEQTD